MNDIKLKLNDRGHGSFLIMDGGEKIAEMVIGISGNNLTVYHTEVSKNAEGKGLAKKLLSYMATYAREHQMKVTPLCPYVHVQFKRHPEEYADVWKREKV